VPTGLGDFFLSLLQRIAFQNLNYYSQSTVPTFWLKDSAPNLFRFSSFSSSSFFSRVKLLRAAKGRLHNFWYR